MEMWMDPYKLVTETRLIQWISVFLSCFLWEILGITQTTRLSALRLIPLHSNAQSIHSWHGSRDLPASNHYGSSLLRRSLFPPACHAFWRRVVHPGDSIESEQRADAIEGIHLGSSRSYGFECEWNRSTPSSRFKWCTPLFHWIFSVGKSLRWWTKSMRSSPIRSVLFCVLAFVPQNRVGSESCFMSSWFPRYSSSNTFSRVICSNYSSKTSSSVSITSRRTQTKWYCSSFTRLPLAAPLFWTTRSLRPSTQLSCFGCPFPPSPPIFQRRSIRFFTPQEIANVLNQPKTWVRFQRLSASRNCWVRRSGWITPFSACCRIITIFRITTNWAGSYRSAQTCLSGKTGSGWGIDIARSHSCCFVNRFTHHSISTRSCPTRSVLAMNTCFLHFPSERTSSLSQSITIVAILCPRKQTRISFDSFATIFQPCIIAFLKQPWPHCVKSLHSFSITNTLTIRKAFSRLAIRAEIEPVTAIISLCSSCFSTISHPPVLWILLPWASIPSNLIISSCLQIRSDLPILIRSIRFKETCKVRIKDRSRSKSRSKSWTFRTYSNPASCTAFTTRSIQIEAWNRANWSDSWQRIIAYRKISTWTWLICCAYSTFWTMTIANTSTTKCTEVSISLTALSSTST